MHTKELLKYHWSCLALLLFSNILWLSCAHNPENQQHPVEQLGLQFIQIDSIYLSGDTVALGVELDRIRPLIAKNDIISWGNYYLYRGAIQIDPIDRNSYVDSAMSLYTSTQTQVRYKTEYIKVLIAKSEVLILHKRYDEALENYFKIRSLADPTENPIAYSEYNIRIAQLYYAQQRYRQAAHYHLIAHTILQSVETENPQYLFYLRQGAISNAGFSYEQANMLDSAAFLYNKGLAYLKEEDEKNIVGKRMLNASKIVFLDNLGGLKAKTGDLETARSLLKQSIATPVIENEVDKEKEVSKNTAFLKLANVYMQMGDLAKADSLLRIAEQNMPAVSEDTYNIAPRVLKARSDLAATGGDYKTAHSYLLKYMDVLDSLQQKNKELSGIDFNLKFESIQDKQDIALLSKIVEKRTYSLMIAGLFLVMLVFIIVLVLKNSRQARKAQRMSVEHNKQLENVITQLEVSNQEYAKIMKVMAHDLKNPLGGIVGISTVLLSDTKLSGEQKELLQLISDSGGNMMEMIDELLHSNLVTEKEDFKKEKIDIQLLLHQCVELLQYKANEKQQVIQFRSEGPVTLELSREKIWRVFNNLIVNAIKFSPANSKIEVILGKRDDTVRIAVIDNGIGVPTDDRERIFDLFTAAKRPGTAGEKPFGIGLSITRQIIEAHGGKIWLEGNPEGGTVFYVELPPR